jgi:hypothetical protein
MSASSEARLSADQVPDTADEPEAKQAMPAGPRRTPHGDVLVFGPAAVLSLALTAIAGYALDLDRTWWALVTIAAALLAILVARAVLGASLIAGWWACAFAAAGGWLAWARFADLRTSAPWLWLAGPAVLVLTCWPLAVRRVLARENAEQQRDAERERQRKETRWPRLLERLGCPGVVVEPGSRADTASGYAVCLRLPADGKVTYEQLVSVSYRLEIASRSRKGAIRFEDSRDSAAHVWMYVSSQDVLATDIPYDVGDGQLWSINGPLPAGRYEDGEAAALTMREVSVLMVGVRNSGKSNALNVIIAQLARCADALVFVIDMKHRLAAAWVNPFLEDGESRAVDWVATTRDEAELMLRSLIAAIDARAAAGEGEEKIEPSPEHPAVVLVVDEAASIFGAGSGPRYSSEGTTNATLAGLGTDLVRRGRSEAIDAVIAAQRGTVTMTGGGDLKSQCTVRIALRATSQADAATVIPDDQQAAKLLADLKHPGTGLLETDDSRPAPMRWMRITPAQIKTVARTYGPWKPHPDPVLAQALGEDYATRWERFRAARKAEPAATAERDEFAEITAQLADVEASNATSTARQVAREFMARNGNRGVSVAMIADRLRMGGMATAERTIRDWLAADIKLGLAEKAAYGRYRVRLSNVA